MVYLSVNVLALKINRWEVLFKLCWIVLVLATIYIFGWMTFLNLTLDTSVEEPYTIWNLLVPNSLSVGLLLMYTKELLLGYKPKSNKGNLKSLLFCLALIGILFLVQWPQFENMVHDMEFGYWPMLLPLVMLLTTYVGLLTHRIIKFKHFSSANRLKSTT